MKRLTLLMSACWSVVGVLGQETLVPYTFDWTRAAESVVDLSEYLDAPAGRDGFIRVRDGRLIKPDDTRFRFWGVNICGADCYPSKEDAELVAADLARFGINCVRFHHLDSTWGRSIFDQNRDDTRQFDAENLDRLDYFIAKLKERGIYSNLNLNVLRRYKAGDGVRDFEILGIGKSATYFNPRLIELQHEFARQLLSHRNAYTGNQYSREPAVAVVEMVNENSVLEGWVTGRLIGRDDRAGDTWSPVPVSYAEELTDLYNAWLTAELPAEQLDEIRAEAGAGPDGRVPRLKPDEFGSASTLRFRTEAQFYLGLEQRFFDGMKRLLKEELGVLSLLVGTADHNDSFSGYAHVSANLGFDIVDGHGYWEHPRISGETWIKNTPMVNDPLDSTVTQFARTPVVGYPYTISEVNHPFPHEYACEGWPILTAYALFHDWDGIYWFSFGPGRCSNGGRGMGHWFDFSNDPIKLANLAACAPMWYRHDVRPAERTVVRTHTREEMLDSLRMDRSKERPFFKPGFARSTPLQHATRFAIDGETLTSVFPPAAPLDRIVSDTGELAWAGADRQQGLVSVDTARSQALIGFVRDSPVTLPHLAAEVTNRFCSLVLTALDDQPLARSARLLLTVTARVTHTGFEWKEDRQSVAEWGTLPPLLEPVSGVVRLRGLETAGELRVFPLTPEGRLRGRLGTARREEADWVIPAGDPPTTWYLIEPVR